ncbi:MAG TPA: VWA domain-containing protein [Pyrinomonadaceae bacterium]
MLSVANDIQKVKKVFLLALFPFLLCCTVSIQAQEDKEEVVRVNTRVVFIDTLVKDQRTGISITDLTQDNFEVFDNGKRREITYFTREGDSRTRALALFIILAPLDDGARKNFQRPEVVNSLAAALHKLPPQDEVGLMILGRNGDARILTELTLDRAKVVKALTELQKFSERKMPSADNAPKVLQDAALSIAKQRPNSQVTVVMLTDSVFLMNQAQRDEVAANLLRANVTFNSLITGTDLMFKLFTPILRPAEKEFRWYDSPQYLAEQTGGDSARPRKKKEYGAALERLIGNLAARYNIGFTLSDEEADDGKLRRLEVKVEARDSQGQKRKIDVSARQGYYIPKK